MLSKEAKTASGFFRVKDLSAGQTKSCSTPLRGTFLETPLTHFPTSALNRGALHRHFYAQLSHNSAFLHTVADLDRDTFIETFSHSLPLLQSIMELDSGSLIAHFRAIHYFFTQSLRSTAAHL